MSNLSPNDEQQNNKRMMTAVLISVGILLFYHFFVQVPQQIELNKLHHAQQQQQQALAKKNAPPVAATKTANAAAPVSRGAALTASARVAIRGDKVSGSINLTGARIDDITLNDQYRTISKKHPVVLLAPAGTKEAYYVEGGWTAGKGTAVPGDTTVWQLSPGSAKTLVSGGSVTLQWNNGAGLLFTRKISLDKNYLFTVVQSVTNNTQQTVSLQAWHMISRRSMPTGFHSYYVDEGPIAFLNGDLYQSCLYSHEETCFADYKELDKGKKVDVEKAQGWVGFTDKYWYVGLYTPPKEQFEAKIFKQQSYKTEIVSPAQELAPGKTVSDTKYVFAGIKHMPIISAYEKAYHFPRMYLMIDFGLLSFIVKPFFYFLHFLIRVTGSVGGSIILLTLILRGAMFPLSNRSYRSMAKMKKLGPQLKELQAKYASDRDKLQLEIFELYKREDVNPFGGCWPMLVQFPIFIALYKTLLLSVEIRHAPFWGWIHDLSAADPTNVFTLFGLIHWNPPEALHVGAWPLLYGISMFLTQRLSPPAPDKAQNNMQVMMPLVFTFMFARFSAGLVIYFTCSGVAGLVQQYYIMRQAGEEDVSLLRGHGARYKKKADDKKDKPKK